MGLQHDNPNVPPQFPLRTQRMTADEARSVIDQWQKERVEQTGLTDRPAVPDVAEGLDIPVEEVQRLLGEVQARRLEEERLLAQEQELSEVRLAEEERRLAEIRRQRAELHREQMAIERQQGQQEAYSKRPSLYTKTPGISTPGKLLALMFAVALALEIAALNASHRPHIYTKVSVGPYGRPMPDISTIPIVCYDGNSEVPCDDVTIERERQGLASEKNGEITPKSKENDTKTHR